MDIKAVIIDFDGTITTQDMSSLLAAKAGKKEESERLNQLFHEGKLLGLTGLIRRINFLKGITIKDLESIVDEEDFIRQGALEFFEYLKENKIISIVASGNLIPLLEIYQKKLAFDYIVGSRPQLDNNVIVGIKESDYSCQDFKVKDSMTILEKLRISKEEVVAIGDSPADRGIMNFATISIAINPKGGIETFARQG